MKIKFNHITSTALVFLTILISLPAFTQTLPIKPGNYDETVDLSYDKKTGIISGIIARSNNDNPNGPRISCSMLFKSASQPKTAGANKYPVAFYNQGDSTEAGKGYIEITKDGINIKCDGDFSSCQNLMDLGGETGEPFGFTTPRSFISANVIKSAKAPIYKTASDTAKSKMYLVKDNFISVVTIKDNWVSFEYMTASGKRVKGWLKKEDIGL
jgi:hypothetical protein